MDTCNREITPFLTFAAPQSTKIKPRRNRKMVNFITEKKLHVMRKLFPLLIFTLSVSLVFAQQAPVIKSNYQLAARFSPTKLSKLIYSTSVDPHWLKKSNRFWYQYETAEGKRWFIVDPAKASKQALFDNAKLAAAITRI